MKDVVRHQVNLNPLHKRHLSNGNSALQTLLESVSSDPQNFRMRVRNSIDLAALSTELLPERDPTISFWFHHACDLIAATFQAAYGDSEEPEQRVTLLDKVVTVPQGSHSGTYPDTWLDGFFLTLILRRADGMKSLAYHSPTQRGLQGDCYIEFWADAYPQWLVLEDGDPDGVFELAEGRCEEAVLDPRKAKSMDIHFIRASRALLHEDAGTFNEELLSGLQGHKRIRGSKKERIHLRNLLCFEALGLCSLAYDRNIPIEVESGYIPKWIYEGGCVERPDMQAYVKEVSGS